MPHICQDELTMFMPWLLTIMPYVYTLKARLKLFFRKTGY
jgi:hypothetical protein